MYETLGLVARLKPLHIGGAVMLEYSCIAAKNVKIGIGSSNKYDVRNPFTAEESKHMVDRYLQARGINNYEVFFIPDKGHIPEYSDGKKWKEIIKNTFGNLDIFVTGNDYVTNLLEDTYKIVHPSLIIPKDKWIKMKGSVVRTQLALGKNIDDLVPYYIPKETAEVMKEYNLANRFKKEFGLETLSLLNSCNLLKMDETLEEEKEHIRKI